MKLCLGLMVCSGEAPWLRLHLPYLLPHVDGLVVVCDTDTDAATRLALAHLNLATGKVYVYAHDWHWDFAEKANWLIHHAEQDGYDMLFRLDPDEIVFDFTLYSIKGLLPYKGHIAASFLRYNFEQDRLRYMPQYFPDRQVRTWLLNRGVHYEGRVHEWPVQSGAVLPLDHAIFHYEGIRPNDVRRYEKHHNYALLAKGQSPVHLPDDFPVPDGFGYRPHIPFDGPQPLDPAVIGPRAPFEEA